MQQRVAAWVCAAFVMMGTGAAAQSPFPLALGGDYALTDHTGGTRTQADPDGRAQLVFFGYVNCPDICTAAFPMMADVTQTLEDEGVLITPVMITIAPDIDTPEAMQAPLRKWHDRFVGLTGSEVALAAAYEAFSVEITPLFQDPEYGWIYAHGSFIHLLDAEGEVLTLIPPILDAERATEIVRSYVGATPPEGPAD